MDMSPLAPNHPLYFSIILLLLLAHQIQKEPFRATAIINLLLDDYVFINTLKSSIRNIINIKKCTNKNII